MSSSSPVSVVGSEPTTCVELGESAELCEWQVTGGQAGWRTLADAKHAAQGTMFDSGGTPVTLRGLWTEGKELNCRPQARRRNGGNTAGRRAGAGPPHLLSGGLNVHDHIWKR